MGNPTFHIKTEELTDPAQAVLLMTAGDFFFSYALMNFLSKEIVEFGYYNLANKNADPWPDFFENNEALSERYYQSAIAFNAAESVLVPSKHYRPEENHLQLNAIYGLNVQAVQIAEHLPGWNMYNVYRVSDSLHSAIKRRFVSGKYWNTNTILINNSSSENHNAIHIDFRTNEFSVLVHKENKLQLASSFSYSSPEDVLYYLLKICQQYDLKQQEVKIILAGLIEKESAIFRELYKYFIHLEFDDLPEDIRIADALSECPRHYFSSICKLAKCVL